tara:strand:- start:910 stop:2085 length:1176 start_codon:yes stop_codon:yes gene_type:complete
MNALVTSSIVLGTAAILVLFLMLFKTSRSMVLVVSCLLLLCSLVLVIYGGKEDKQKSEKFSSRGKKIGVVVVTHGNNGILIRQCIYSFLQILPNDAYIVLYVNESNDPITLGLSDLFSEIKYVYVSDQHGNGGLTGAWNQGIQKCIDNECEIIVIANDDILIDPSLEHILNEAENCQQDTLAYYGPVSNNPGPKDLNRTQAHTNYGTGTYITHDNLNGFFMVFPLHSLLRNKFDDINYFDPMYPFGGNETEWYNRFRAIGGTGYVVSDCLVYHYKLALWRLERKQIVGDSKKVSFTVSIDNNNPIRANRKTELMDLPEDRVYFANDVGALHSCIQYGILPMVIISSVQDLDYRQKGEISKLTVDDILRHPDKYFPAPYLECDIRYLDSFDA